MRAAVIACVMGGVVAVAGCGAGSGSSGKASSASKPAASTSAASTPAQSSAPVSSAPVTSAPPAASAPESADAPSPGPAWNAGPYTWSLVACGELTPPQRKQFASIDPYSYEDPYAAILHVTNTELASSGYTGTTYPSFQVYYLNGDILQGGASTQWPAQPVPPQQSAYVYAGSNVAYIHDTCVVNGYSVSSQTGQELGDWSATGS